WYKAHTGIISNHNIARRDANAGYLDIAIDFDCFQAGFTGQRGYFTGPHRILDTAGMSYVPDTAENNRARFTLTLACLRRDASHIGYTRYALNDNDVAVQCQIMRFELGHLV